MSQTRKLNQVPEYGWTRKTLLDDVDLSEPGGLGAISDVVDRPPGAFQVGISGRVLSSSTTGPGFFGFVLEGSNTGGDTISLVLTPVAGGPYTVGETVTGGSSGATGVVTEVGTPATVPAADSVTIVIDTWNEVDFQPGETVTGGASGATGDVVEALLEWTELGRTNLNELFDADSAFTETRTLGLSEGLTTGAGFIGSGVVPCGRWSKLRVRSFVQIDSPSFTISVRLTAIAGNGEAREEVLTLTRASGDVVEPVSSAMLRPEGTRFLSAQLIVDEMINVPDAPDTEADGFSFQLQAALDQAAVDAGEFETLDELGVLQVKGETRFFANGQVRLIDLGSFNFFRVLGLKVTAGTTPSSDLSSYTVRALLNFDDNDWLDGARGIGFMPEQLQEVFVQQHYFVPQSAGGTLWDIRIQVCNINLQPLRNTRPIGLLLSDSLVGGAQDLTAGASIDSASKGTILFGAGTNYAVIQTDVDGEAIIRLDTGGADPTFLVGWNLIPNVPELNISDFGPGQVLISTDRQQFPPP